MEARLSRQYLNQGFEMFDSGKECTGRRRGGIEATLWLKSIPSKISIFLMEGKTCETSYTFGFG